MVVNKFHCKIGCDIHFDLGYNTTSILIHNSFKTKKQLDKIEKSGDIVLGDHLNLLDIDRNYSWTEEDLGILIRFEKLLDFQTVQNILNYISSHNWYILEIKK